MEVQHLPQPTYISQVKWVSSSHILTSTNSPNSLQTLSIKPQSQSQPLSTFPFPSSITSLSLSTSTSTSLVAASTTSSLSFISLNPTTAAFGTHTTFDSVTHVTGIDLGDNGDCVCVGEDGRVDVVRVGDGAKCYRVGFGGVGFRTVKWASRFEFVTGGFGFGLSWWDVRIKAGPPSAQFKPRAVWPHRATSGIVHSIDILTSRKHTCIAGGSAGTVFAWDLRWQHQPIVLSGVGFDENLTQSPSESEVWKVQYDSYTSSLNMSNFSSSRILPAVICSEDGILAVVEEGEKPCELLAEPCAINSFDINQENPSDIICCLEWESLAVVTRQ